MSGRHRNLRNSSEPDGDVDPFAGMPGMLPVAVLHSPDLLPDALSAVLKDLDGKVSSVDVGRALVDRTPDASVATRGALLDVAAAADRSGLENAYHNPVHSRDVGVIFANLLRLQALLSNGSTHVAGTDLLIGCCAAFGHDIGHDGSYGGPDATPFRLELQAADLVEAILVRHHVAPAQIERVRCAILATDVHDGYRALDEAGRGVLATFRNLPPSLYGLSDPATRAWACLLRDADVMQSAGLTPDDHDRQTARLERERGMPTHAMGVRGADFFLKDVIKGRFLSQAGRVFQPRLDRLLQLNALRAQGGQGANGLAAFDG